MFEGDCDTICQIQELSRKKIKEQNTLGSCVKTPHLPIGYSWPDTLHTQGVVNCTAGLDDDNGDTDEDDTNGNEGLRGVVTGGVQ